MVKLLVAVVRYIVSLRVAIAEVVGIGLLAYGAGLVALPAAYVVLGVGTLAKAFEWDLLRDNKG